MDCPGVLSRHFLEEAYVGVEDGFLLSQIRWSWLHHAASLVAQCDYGDRPA